MYKNLKSINRKVGADNYYRKKITQTKKKHIKQGGANHTPFPSPDGPIKTWSQYRRDVRAKTRGVIRERHLAEEAKAKAAAAAKAKAAAAKAKAAKVAKAKKDKERWLKEKELRAKQQRLRKKLGKSPLKPDQKLGGHYQQIKKKTKKRN